LSDVGKVSTSKMNVNNAKCVNEKCNCVADHQIIYLDQTGEDIIYKLPRIHLQCIKCGCQFNKWLASKDRIKEVFGDEYHLYR
jgi:hypothetical protein